MTAHRMARSRRRPRPRVNVVPFREDVRPEAARATHDGRARRGAGAAALEGRGRRAASPPDRAGRSARRMSGRRSRRGRRRWRAGRARRRAFAPRQARSSRRRPNRGRQARGPWRERSPRDDRGSRGIGRHPLPRFQLRCISGDKTDKTTESAGLAVLTKSQRFGGRSMTDPRPARVRLGMVGGGKEAFIGAVHRIASRIDDRFELVAGAFSSTSKRSRDSGLAACARLPCATADGVGRQTADAVDDHDATKGERGAQALVLSVTPSSGCSPRRSGPTSFHVGACRTPVERRDVERRPLASGSIGNSR